MTTEELAEIGSIVFEAAREIFHMCMADDDFCVQYVGMECVVFGGTNRMTFSRYGWSIEKSYCTVRFAELFEQNVRLGLIN